MSSEPYRKWGQHYYIVLFSPLLPFHWPQNNDLEWPVYVKFCFFSPICLELWSMAFGAWLLLILQWMSANIKPKLTASRGFLAIARFSCLDTICNIFFLNFLPGVRPNAWLLDPPLTKGNVPLTGHFTVTSCRRSCHVVVWMGTHTATPTTVVTTPCNKSWRPPQLGLLSCYATWKLILLIICAPLSNFLPFLCPPLSRPVSFPLKF